MQVHNELGPGHREADYQDALAIEFKQANLNFVDEPEILIALDSGEVVKTRRPDFVVEQVVIVELKGRSHLMTKDDEAQVIGYFAALPDCPRSAFHQLWTTKIGIPSFISA